MREQYIKLSVNDLKKICKKRNIKGYSNLNKGNIINILLENDEGNKERTESIIKINTEINLDLKNELKEKHSKFKISLMCKQCHAIGHNDKSDLCPINFEINKRIREKTLDNKNKIDIKYLSVLYNKPQSYISNEIKKVSQIDILNNEILTKHDIEDIKKQKLKQCYECNRIYHINNNKKWKDNTNCFKCWNSQDKQKEREELWNLIIKLDNKCNICGIERDNDYSRFNYDHLNMFDKHDAISNMINQGVSCDTILKEIKKCQLLCFDCHNLITDIENEYGFTSLKTTLTKQLNTEKITCEEYNKQTSKLRQIYNDKMTEIYNLLSN